jgi:RNA-directed DNA polymerase
MTAKQARIFLMEPTSYCNIDLPSYFRFDAVLSKVAKVLSGKKLCDLSSKPRECEGVNHPLLSNKDGRHAWRPFQLIHPAMYVSLVETITAKDAWESIRNRFDEFQKLPGFGCLSIPRRSTSKHTDKATQILNWWQGIEQASIALALKYGYLFTADITDCYAAIYTHSIAWALHGKALGKADKTRRTLLGTVIDGHIQDMRHGQTNGIPQGSVLMDLISEIVLGYADSQLSNRLTESGTTEFKILRYRDDYRIFVHSPEVGDRILKELTSVLVDLGLKLNAAKTAGSQHVISHSVKADKRAWLSVNPGGLSHQKHLLLIHAHGIAFQNAGSLTTALSKFHRQLSTSRRIQNPEVLISIVTDIAYMSPRTVPICAAVISKLLSVLESKAARIATINAVHAKLSKLPNAGHMEMWIQRISHPILPSLSFGEALCRLVKGEEAEIWSNAWITCKKLKAAVAASNIVDTNELRSLRPVIRPKEVDAFASEAY